VSERKPVVKEKRVVSTKTGQAGVVIKTLNNCLWVKMDDGTEWSGAKQYWKPEPKNKERNAEHT
jgi:hypothetical protein